MREGEVYAWAPGRMEFLPTEVGKNRDRFIGGGQRFSFGHVKCEISPEYLSGNMRKWKRWLLS